MKHLLTLHPADVGASSNPDTAYRERSAARAVMLDQNTKVYLVHMKTRGYYKLPGGGIDDGEETDAALHRELMEECGTDGEIIAEVGTIEEFREGVSLHQLSYCYLVRQKGSRVLPEYEQHETDDGAELYIADSVEHAIRLVEEFKALDDEVRFMQRRDSTFLREAQRLLTST